MTALSDHDREVRRLYNRVMDAPAPPPVAVAIAILVAKGAWRMKTWLGLWVRPSSERIRIGMLEAAISMCEMHGQGSHDVVLPDPVQVGFPEDLTPTETNTGLVQDLERDMNRLAKAGKLTDVVAWSPR